MLRDFHAAEEQGLRVVVSGDCNTTIGIEYCL